MIKDQLLSALQNTDTKERLGVPRLTDQDINISFVGSSLRPLVNSLDEVLLNAQGQELEHPITEDVFNEKDAQASLRLFERINRYELSIASIEDTQSIASLQSYIALFIHEHSKQVVGMLEFRIDQNDTDSSYTITLPFTEKDELRGSREDSGDGHISFDDRSWQILEYTG